MREDTKWALRVGAMLAGGMLAGGFYGIVWAPTAEADSQSYMDAIHQEFNYPYTEDAVASAIDVGYSVCQMVRVSGVKGVNDAVTGLIDAGFSGQEAKGIAMAAGNELCPEILGTLYAWSEVDHSVPTQLIGV